MDRRYLRTERLLVSAMLDLISETAFQEIRVEDIVKRADVARKTFYAHFKNKDELLWHSLATHFQSIETTIRELQPQTLLAGSKPLSYAVFKHVHEYQVFYKSMLLSKQGTAFIFQFLDYVAHESYARLQPLRDTAKIITVDPELIAHLLAGGLIGALRWWLQTGLRETPEQMAYRYSQIVAPGILQSMGLE